MKRVLTGFTALLLLAGSIGAASAQGHDDHADNHPGNNHGPAMAGHANWHSGGRIEKNDWNRGQKIDYRSHHLKVPPRGYEWRQVDNNYVLAAAATGLIASVILASH